jgi:hypothetical protein
MDGKTQCPTCGRQLDSEFQFCPFDKTPLRHQCPACGRVWDPAYQFCPFDSTRLAEPAAPSSPLPPPLEPPAPAAQTMEAPGPAQTAAAPAAPPRPAPAPRPAAFPGPSAVSSGAAPGAGFVPKPTSFTFAEQVKPPTWRDVVFRPLTVFVACAVAAIGFFVYYLIQKTSGPDLPLPTISYTLLPNEGKTKGVPVAIKVNQLTVFMIDDPMDAEGATRAKQIVATLQDIIRPLKAENTGGIRFAVDTVNGRPAILEVTQDGPDRRTITSVTEGDMALAGETDPMRLAGQWAERLTDAIKVFVFGEAPNFSTGTEFGDTLLVMYKAAAGSAGKVSKKSLDAAFAHLPPAQQRALETPPLARKTSARAAR